MDGGTQQPTKSRPKQWDIVGGDGTQGNDNGGGRCRIVLAIQIGGKKLNKQNSPRLYAAANQQINTTTNQMHAGVSREGFDKTRNRRGTQGERYLIILGVVKLGGGRE